MSDAKNRTGTKDKPHWKGFSNKIVRVFIVMRFNTAFSLLFLSGPKPNDCQDDWMTVSVNKPRRVSYIPPQWVIPLSSDLLKPLIPRRKDGLKPLQLFVMCHSGCTTALYDGLVHIWMNHAPFVLAQSLLSVFPLFHKASLRSSHYWALVHLGYVNNRP